MKIGLIFPGQASQYVGMGKEFYNNYSVAKKLFDTANEILGYDLKKIIFEGPIELLTQTIHTQPAVFVTSVACFEVFSASYPIFIDNCSFVAGHSLGEYSAMYVVGVFDFSTGLKLVRKRAEFIQTACDKNPGTMAAIIGVDKTKLSELCNEVMKMLGAVVELVNFNSPEQIVISGNTEAVTMVMERVKSLGGKSIQLKVSGAFHSSLMREASELMSKELAKVAISDPKIPVITNCDACPTNSAEEIKQKLVKQISSPVYWQKSIEYMISHEVDTFIEIGPGKVLSGMIKKINSGVKVMNIEDEKSLKESLRSIV